MTTTTQTRPKVRRGRKWDVAEVAEWRSKKNPETGRQYSLRWCAEWLEKHRGVSLSIEAIRLALEDEEYVGLVEEDEVSGKLLPWVLPEWASHDYNGLGCRAVATVVRARANGTLGEVDHRIKLRAEAYLRWVGKLGPVQPIVRFLPKANDGVGGWEIRPRKTGDGRAWYGLMVP